MRRAVLAILVAGIACVDTGPGPGPLPKVDPKDVRKHLLTEVPADIERFDIKLGDHVVYVGNRIDRKRLAPGQELLITHYWKVLKPPGKRWRPFALVRGPEGSSDFMNLDPTDMQRGHPVAKWKADDIIEDMQPITIRPDWRSPYAYLQVGLIEVGKHGTLDRMAVTGPHTQDRAIIAAKLEIDLSRAPPPPGTIHIPRASGPITIDGMQIDEAWRTAIVSPEFVTGESSADPPGKATAKLLWDDVHLYAFVSIEDPDVTSPYTKRDEPLWKADCIELFIDADGNRQGYIELQVSPRNTQFDSWFASTRAAPGDVTWSSEMISEVRILEGTADPKDRNRGWEVELAIPWAAVKGRAAQMAVALPPRIGDRWRLNINRVDVTSSNDRQTVSAWNRIGNDWHGLDRMLVAVFADPTGSIHPPAATPENPAGAGSAAPVAPAPGSGAGVAPPPAIGSAAGPGSAAATRAPMVPVAPGVAPGSGVMPPPGAGTAATPQLRTSPPGAGTAATPRTTPEPRAPTPGAGTGTATPATPQLRAPPPGPGTAATPRSTPAPGAGTAATPRTTPERRPPPGAGTGAAAPPR